MEGTDDAVGNAGGTASGEYNSNEGGDERLLELKVAAKRARDYAEELEANVERIRIAKRQKTDLMMTDDNAAEETTAANNMNIPGESDQITPTMQQPVPVAVVDTTTEPDDAKPAAKPVAERRIVDLAMSAPVAATVQPPVNSPGPRLPTTIPAPMAATVQPPLHSPAPRLPIPPTEQPRYVLSHVQSSARSPNTPEGATWQYLLKDSALISINDVGVAPDAMMIALAQFQLCLLTASDRMGRYKHQDIGYVGLCCKYCFGQPGYGRFFPSTSSSFVSSFPQTVVKHVSEDCLGTPRWIMKLVETTRDSGQRSDPTRASHFGSKGLMERIWNIIRSSNPAEIQDVPDGDPLKEEMVLSIRVNESDEDSLTWRDVIGQDSDRLVKISDQYLVPASLFAAVAQYERCEANENDCRSIGRNRAGINPGYPGICCKHCKGHTPPVLPGARIFPAQSGSLSQIETSSKLQAHIENNRCGKVPLPIKNTIVDLREKEKVDTRRYGSRKIFFKKIWDRLHGQESAPEEPTPEMEADDLPLRMELPGLVEGSVLVNLDTDRGMVSDAHLVAFAQLKPCTLTKEDQIGWYKEREMGFPGVCCRHCEGRPSSGRYFPKHGDFFLRSSKQSIMKHVIENCGQVPADVRESLNELQRRDQRRKGWKITNRSVLGQGKLFHERIWRRLYTALEVNTSYPMPPDEPVQTNAESLSNSAAAEPTLVAAAGETASADDQMTFAAPAASTNDVLVEDSIPRVVSRKAPPSHIVPGRDRTCDEAGPAVANPTPAVAAHHEDDVPMEQKVAGTNPTPVPIVDNPPHPSADRDHVIWICLVHCKSLDNMLGLVISDKFSRIFQRIRLLHEDFLSKLTPLYPDEPLHGDTGFDAQNNWYAGWARRVRKGDAAAFQLTLDRRACRTVLFALFDLWQDKSLQCDVSQRNVLNQWIPDILMIVLPMDRAECLYAMKNSNADHYGMHWVSKEHTKHPLFVEVVQNGGIPAMNLRFLKIQQAISCPDTLKVARRLTVPTECPREPITEKPAAVVLPSDVSVNGAWVIPLRGEVLDRISHANRIELFVSIYKSEAFSISLHLLRSNPEAVVAEDIDMLLKLYEKLFACLTDEANLSVTKESVLKKFKKQSFTNVLDQIVATGNYRKSVVFSNWPPSWLVGLCDMFDLDGLRPTLQNTASV